MVASVDSHVRGSAQEESRPGMDNRDRRQGRKEEGIARRKMRREFFDGVSAETHHAFARADVHQVLAKFGYWLHEFDSDFATYVRRGGKDYIETCRSDGTWRHVVPDEGETSGQGGGSLEKDLRNRT